MPSTDDAPDAPTDSRSFGTRLQVGWERATRNLPLAFVPLLSSLLAPDNLRRVRSYEGNYFGLALQLPSSLPDLWTFVSLPNGEPGIHVSPTLWLLPVLVPLQAALVAGLLGSAHEFTRTGGYDFAANVRRYFVPVLVFVALVRAVALGTGALATAALPVVFLVVPLLLLVLSYVFYATPYLLVVEDASVGEALATSYDWATEGGPYLAYAAGYLLVVFAVSAVGSAFVVNLGVLGAAVGAVVSAPLALALTFTTVEFVADMGVGRGAGGDTRPGSGGGGRGAGDGDGSEPDADRSFYRDLEGESDRDDRWSVEYRDERAADRDRDEPGTDWNPREGW
ncbi:hypothetical protein [Halorussus sp. MSC15.2]|uniref:hypothetical protein n=1 Tax=Halorussus sp. MSC15.2 TaxID=2283638 RepID=UPI0013D0760D|nr:hypothetical protein [Halorussus sp. MSC15.2]NEU56809.1 hypothetical protein [Halorussus sp. MSC15.2]